MPSEESDAVVEIGWESIVVLAAVAEVAARVAEVAIGCTPVTNVVGTSKISGCPPSARARDTNIKLEEYILSGLTGTVCVSPIGRMYWILTTGAFARCRRRG